MESRRILEIFPNENELKTIDELIEHLSYFEEVTKRLQGRMNLRDVRKCFDVLIRKYPSVEGYLGKDANIVKDKTFESAIVEVIEHNGKRREPLGPSDEVEFLLFTFC